MLRLKISSKILIYFLGIALIPLIAVSFVLVEVAHNQLLKDASAKQQAVATDLANRVDNYLANKIDLLNFNGRLYSTQGFNASLMNKSLSTLFGQDANLQQVILQESSGYSQTLTKENGKVNTTVTNLNGANSTAIHFLANHPYFISVGRGDQNNPQVIIAVPILKKYGPPPNGGLPTIGSPNSNIIGAIVGHYDVSNLWQSVLSVKIGNGGYAYVVDGSGLLTAHPDKQFLASHKKLSNTQAVKQFVHGNTSTSQTISETGQTVVSTPHKTQTGWAVVAEEPVSSIYAGINSFIKLSAIVGISAILLSVMIGLFFSRQLIKPIRRLSDGAKKLGQGDFEQTINVRTKDELQELADTFNKMGQSIKKLIGDLKTNNLRLWIEQTKLNNIISSVSDGIIALNSRGEIVSINPPAAKLIGQQPNAIRGKLMSEQFPWEHEDKQFAPELRKPGLYHYTDLVLNRGSSIAYLDMMVAVLERQDSNVAAIITIHDQTESRELSFMKLDFVAIAAHELRTPLTVVMGYLDMLNSDAREQLSIFNLENLQKAIVGTDQLRDLINKLLNIARIERGEMEIFVEKLNLTKLVSENVKQHESIAAQKAQDITYHASVDSQVYVPADPASIVEVLNNLIGNAIKYTPDRGKISVNLIAGHNEVRVEISDNGPGVPKELRARLFTKFYRAERSLIAGTRGTGLGLFISKTIVELQQGKIGIAPEQGRGSTFYFTLPIYDPAKHDKLLTKKSAGGIHGWFKKRATGRR